MKSINVILFGCFLFASVQFKTAGAQQLSLVVLQDGSESEVPFYEDGGGNLYAEMVRVNFNAYVFGSQP
ncbi:MAG: hypothetical protein AAFR95_18695, partial [Bacteroidota bacterium]